MQITLNESEVKEAIKNYVGNQGIAIVGKKSVVTLIAGRAPNGMSATIDIADDTHDPSVPIPRAARGGTTIVDVVAPEEEESAGDCEASVVDPNQKPLFGN